MTLVAAPLALLRVTVKAAQPTVTLVAAPLARQAVTAKAPQRTVMLVGLPLAQRRRRTQMIKHSLTMRISELCRAERILGLTDGKRNLKAQRADVRRRLNKLVEQGKVEKVDRAGWRAIY